MTPAGFARISRTLWLAAGFGLPVLLASGRAPAQSLLELAACIRDRGAVYYGAYWCPVCAKQNALFGEFVSLLPYHECYDADTREKRSSCRHVDSFPTWEFADGTVRTGLQPLERLAALTDCPL